VVVGRVGRPYGVRGELHVVPETDFPERLAALRDAYVIRDGRPAPVTIEAVRRTAGGVLVKIAGIASPEAAGAWTGALLAVPREAAAALPEGRYFVFDVIGMAVATDGGEPLGAVEEIIRTPGNDVFVVRGPRGEILIPAIASVVLVVDPAAKRIVVHPLPGLLEDAGPRPARGSAGPSQSRGQE
jgi:16S rRNA processing protein RimM